MNIKLGVKFEVGKVDVDPFQDDDEDDILFRFGELSQCKKMEENQNKTKLI